MEKWVVPILKSNKKETSTGLAVPDDGLSITDIKEIDREDMERKGKWHLIQLHYELFGDHPTWGPPLGGAMDTATIPEEPTDSATPASVKSESAKCPRDSDDDDDDDSDDDVSDSPTSSNKWVQTIASGKFVVQQTLTLQSYFALAAGASRWWSLPLKPLCSLDHLLSRRIPLCIMYF